jgi:uncharacterized protein with GYD domain
LVKWTDQGAKGAKDILSRTEQGPSMTEQAGGRRIGSWFTQGQYDAVIINEWPDDETASAAAIGLGIIGNARTETMRAYTREDMQRILDKLP